MNTDAISHNAKILEKLPGWLQKLCEAAFGVKNEGQLSELADFWHEFFKPDASVTRLNLKQEPYLLSSKHRIAFAFKYLLFGIAASKDRLRRIIDQSELQIPIVPRYIPISHSS